VPVNLPLTVLGNTSALMAAIAVLGMVWGCSGRGAEMLGRIAEGAARTQMLPTSEANEAREVGHSPQDPAEFETLALGQGQEAEPPQEEVGLVSSPEPGWPQWRGKRRDGISEETGLLPSWPPGGPRLLWTVSNLGRGWASPIVVNDRIFVPGDIGQDLVIFAFDTGGKLLWRAVNGEAWLGSYPGCRASCVYSEGLLYHCNAHGRIACFDATSGREIWAVDMVQLFEGRKITWGISECLLVDGQQLFITPAGRKGLMASLDKRTGKILWVTPPIAPDDFVSHSSPILFRWGGRRILANCSAAFGFGVDADTGQRLWAVPVRNQFDTNVSTPIFGGDRIFYVSPYTHLGRQYKLMLQGGKIAVEYVWTHPVDTVTGSGVLVNGVLWIGGYRRPKWWFAIDWQTAQTLAETKELTTGSAIYADGRLYILDETGKVALVDPSEKRFDIVGQFQLPAGKVRDAWAHPVVCNGRLYLRHHDSLWCYDICGSE
jgi:outer membrane protein assembly factor BamB